MSQPFVWRNKLYVMNLDFVIYRIASNSKLTWIKVIYFNDFIEPEFIRQLKKEFFHTFSPIYGDPGQFLVDGEKIIFCSSWVGDGCKTTWDSNLNKKNESLTFTLRKTFFDIINEDIGYPCSSNSDVFHGLSLAHGKIITTSKLTNYSLFSYENDSWTKSDVDSPKILSFEYPDEYEYPAQLLTVKNLERLR